MVIETVCVMFFTLEFVARVVFAPDKNEFFRQALNWCDLLSIVPFYLEQLMNVISPNYLNSSTERVDLELLNFLRIFRIFRVFKVAKNVTGLKILM